MFLLCSKLRTLVIVLLCCYSAWCKVGDDPVPPKNATEVKKDTQRFLDLTEMIESSFKNVIKGVVKYMMPSLVRLNEDAKISPECLSSLMKFLKGLNQAKVWAVKMLDASSKLPAGFVMGTFADYGSFDECLDLYLPEGEGRPTFRGMSCALEAKPPLPPISHDYTLVKSTLPMHNGTLRDYFRVSHEALHHKKFRLVVCVPSTCSIQDIRQIASKVAEASNFDVKVPKCYVKEETKLEPIHWALISCLSVLLVLCIIGTIVDLKLPKLNSSEKKGLTDVLSAFSLSSNLNRLLSASGGASELRCVHGIRALSMCWIVLGHTYVLMDFELLKDPAYMQQWFASLEFELINNGWLAVETFFLLSGALVSYGGLKAMDKTKKTFNVPLLIVRRYVRLTPALLLLMGLVFFLPLLSSGPFSYEHIDPQVDSCTKYWWTTLLYISNWYGIDKGCTLTTWYLGVDFQLHIISLLMLIIIFKYSKFGLSLLVSLIGISCAAVGLQTILYDTTATVQLSTVDDEKVLHVLNHVHVYTPTHLGPYCIGMVLGYCIFRHREKKISKIASLCGWILSTFLCLSIMFGLHPFTTGEISPHSPLAVFYASIHRSVFATGIAWVVFACIVGHGGIAWVVFACIVGHGGPINSLLSSSILAPMSRLTFMIYLVHPLVIWTRLGSLRERIATTHYDFVYEYLANQVVSVAVAVPFYLLLEAPLSNLDRMVFFCKDSEEEKEKQNNKLDSR